MCVFNPTGSSHKLFSETKSRVLTPFLKFCSVGPYFSSKNIFKSCKYKIKIRIQIGHLSKSGFEFNNDQKYKTPLLLDKISKLYKNGYRGWGIEYYSFQTSLKPQGWKAIIDQSEARFTFSKVIQQLATLNPIESLLTREF